MDPYNTRNQTIQTEINGSVVTLSFIDDSKKSVKDTIVSVLSNIYGNKIKDEYYKK